MLAKKPGLLRSGPAELKRVRLRQKLLEREISRLKAEQAPLDARQNRLNKHPASQFNSQDYLTIHYTMKNGKYGERDFDAMQRRNSKKSGLLELVSGRISGKHSALQKEYWELNAKERELQQAIYERERLLKKTKTRFRERHAFRQRLSEPEVFSELVNKATEEFAKFFTKNKIRLPFFDMEATTGKNNYSTVRALGAVFAELSRQTGKIELDQIPESMPMLFQRAGIKRVLEIGSGGRGLVHLLAESGMAKKAGLELFEIEFAPRQDHLTNAKQLGIALKEGDAINIAAIFPGKFDLIVAVGVLGKGGLEGFKRTRERELHPSPYASQSQKIAKSAVQTLSNNPHAMFCTASILGTLSLRRRAIERFSRVRHWGLATYGNISQEKERMYHTSPKTEYFQYDRQFGNAFRNWTEQNRRLIDISERYLEGAANLAILAKK